MNSLFRSSAQASKRKTQDAVNADQDARQGTAASPAPSYRSFTDIRSITPPVNLIPTLHEEDEPTFAVPTSPRSIRSVRTVPTERTSNASSLSVERMPRESSQSSVSSRASSQPSLSHAASIRSVASTSSAGSHYVPASSGDRTPRRPKVASFSSPAPMSPLMPPAQLVEPPGFHLPKPASNAVIESMFGELLTKTGVQAQKRNEMLDWPMDKKWQLVYAEKLNDFRSAQRGAGQASGAIGSARMNGEDDPAHFSGKKNRLSQRKDTPQQYLSSFMDGSVTAKKVASLNVGLRTYEISCVATGRSLSHA
jgi:hypothetical protein